MKVTLKSIAERAGVSVNTVSLALRNMPSVKKETRDNILKIAEELDYFEKKAKLETHNICLVSTGERLRDSYFYMSFHQHILSKVHDYNYNMMVYMSSNCDIDPAELRRNFEVNSVSGVIILGDMEERVVANISQCGIPVVAIGARYYDLGLCTFIEDNLVGSYYAIRYLYERGYRKIGFIGSPRYSSGFMERYQGYVGAMVQFGLVCDPRHVAIDLDEDDVYDYAAIEQALRKMDELPEAFLCANDNLGMITAKALHAMGLSIPKDVAIIGFDNSEIGKMAIPSLTSVDVQCALQAEVSVKRLIADIQSGNRGAERIVLPVRLVEGDSVGIRPTSFKK